jgi:hypothetical protein
MTGGKLNKPHNSAKHRDILAETLINDMSVKALRAEVKKYLVAKFTRSDVNFHEAYFNYFKESYGHCPFGLNSD